MGVPSAIRCALGALCVGACSSEEAPVPAPVPQPRFAGGWVDASDALGLRVDVARGGSDFFMPDSMGPGGALFDADADGDLDVFAVQGIRAPDGAMESDAGRDRLWLQGADGRFVESRGHGLDDPRYGMGAAVADVDGDGDADVFVTNFGSSRLYVNRGDGHFDDRTLESGLSVDGWASTAGFFDYDADGAPDLFVARYLDFDPMVKGKDGGGQPDYPSPLQFQGAPASLWRNQGDGTFRDVSVESNVASLRGRGLGLAFADLDGDGRCDVFVANDSEPNFAWLQLEPGRFVNRAFQLGVAVNRVGRPQANMGVALGDVDGDAQLDIFVTHLVTETNVLYRRVGPQKYADATDGSGLGPPSLDLTGFGTQFADLENDGDLDLAVVNGRVLRRLPRGPSSLSAHWQPYAEENQIFWNDGRGKFRLGVAEDSGDFVRALVVGRALMVGDLDRDGGLDCVVHNGDGSLRAYLNRFDARGHWLAVSVLEPDGRRDAIGARVELRHGDRVAVRVVGTCQGYLTAGPAELHFGLGARAEFDSIVVHWPDGATTSFAGGPADRRLRLVRDAGR